MSRPCQPATYVKVALRLMKRTVGGTVSLGQICWTAHRKPSRIEHEFAAAKALSESGLFQRVWSTAGFAIDLYRLVEKQAEKPLPTVRVELHPSELTAIRMGCRIHAIKLVRERTGCTLSAARAAVESVSVGHEVSL